MNDIEVGKCPPYMVVKITYACNYRCIGCHHGHRKELAGFFKARKQFMPLADYKAIIDEVAEYRLKVGLNSLGEVFLHPDIYEMIEYAEQRGVRIEFDTNGSLLDPVRLAETGVSDVIFSIDGFDQESYAAYRKGGDFEKVRGNLVAFADEVAKRGNKTNIYVKYLVNSATEELLEEARTFYNSLPNVKFLVDYFFLPQPSYHYQMTNPDRFPLDVYEQWRPKKYPEYDLFRPDYEAGVAVNKVSELPFAAKCRDLFRTLYIDTNGDAYPCCMASQPTLPDLTDYADELLLGNVFSEGVLGVYHGDRVNALRKAFVERDGRIPLCATCRANKASHAAESAAGNGLEREYKTVLDFDF